MQTTFTISFPDDVDPFSSISSTYLSTMYPCIPSANTILDQPYPSTLLYLSFSIIVTLCPTVNVVKTVVPDVPGPFLKFPGSTATASTSQFVTSLIFLIPSEIIYPFVPSPRTTLSQICPLSFLAPFSILSIFSPFFNVFNFVEDVLFDLYTTIDASVTCIFSVTILCVPGIEHTASGIFSNTGITKLNGISKSLSISLYVCIIVVLSVFAAETFC